MPRPVSRAGSTVLIDGNRIRTSARTARAIPSQAERIDAAARALLPGLWDMHVHMGPTDGLLHMAAGVTSVRDLANDNDALLQMKRDIDSGAAIGPRITMRGFMDGRGPYTGPTKVFVDTEAEARSAIDNYAKLGYDGHQGLQLDQARAGADDHQARARERPARQRPRAGVHDRATVRRRRRGRDPAHQHAVPELSSSTRSRTRARRRASSRWPERAATLDLNSLPVQRSCGC
jgi:imidazolonepropionase-like amidohydrolase